MSAWCNWHNNDSDTAVPIRRIPGIGYLLRACAACRAAHGLTPLEPEPEPEPERRHETAPPQ